MELVVIVVLIIVTVLEISFIFIVLVMNLIFKIYLQIIVLLVNLLIKSTQLVRMVQIYVTNTSLFFLDAVHFHIDFIKY